MRQVVNADFELLRLDPILDGLGKLLNLRVVDVEPTELAVVDSRRSELRSRRGELAWNTSKNGQQFNCIASNRSGKTPVERREIPVVAGRSKSLPVAVDLTTHAREVKSLYLSEVMTLYLIETVG